MIQALRPTLTSDDLWIMATAVCCAVACAIVGCYLVLRRLSLLGDAISHAILPGLAGAFLVTGTRHPLAMLAGAMVVGVLTAVLSASLSRRGRVPEDAAMGVVFTALFSIGVLMISMHAGGVDLDPGCILYGLIEYVPFDTWPIAGFPVPRAFTTLAAVLLINASIIWVFVKELKITAFDPYLATTMGINAAIVHYGMMTLVAATSVAAFEAVGSVLVVAMLVAPGATAHLLTDRFGRMLWIAAAVSAAAAVIGYLLALVFNSSVAGMISVAAGGEFLLAALFAPRYGFLTKQVQRLTLAQRIAREDVLGLLYRWRERVADGDLTAAQVAEAMRAPWATRLAIGSLRRRGLLEVAAGVRLTDRGIRAAQDVVRSHRLWESYLSDRLGLPPDHLHEPSHRTEHFITAEIRDRLGRELKRAEDPHGRVIPGGPSAT